MALLTVLSPLLPHFILLHFHPVLTEKQKTDLVPFPTVTVNTGMEWMSFCILLTARRSSSSEPHMQRKRAHMSECGTNDSLNLPSNAEQPHSRETHARPRRCLPAASLLLVTASVSDSDLCLCDSLNGSRATSHHSRASWNTSRTSELPHHFPLFGLNCL